ncbi:MAG TPA: nucleotide exchange factor GrpE [Alphaproteobacteria bacterium]
MNEAAKKDDDLTPETAADQAEGASAAMAPAVDAGQTAQIAALQTELADMKDKMLRVMADADNMRKRSERMQLDSTKYAISGFARDLLDVADNLRRALDAISADARAADPALNNFAEGIEATERNMQAALEKHGLRKLAPSSGKFDPNVHEVMFEGDVPGKDAGEIIQLIEPGYMLHDRLIRPARVGVAKGDPNKPKAHGLDESV